MREHLCRTAGRNSVDHCSCVSTMKASQIPCMCGKVYIGETVHRLDTRVNEHLEACKRGETSKSAVAEHAWQPIMWNDTILDRASGQLELRVKEAFHIQLRPSHEHVNRDVGLECGDGDGCNTGKIVAGTRARRCESDETQG